jgi:hypothetical protein
MNLATLISKLQFAYQFKWNKFLCCICIVRQHYMMYTCEYSLGYFQCSANRQKYFPRSM